MLLVTAVLGCAATSPNATMRTLATGSYAAVKPESPQAVAITSADEYATIWEQTLGGNAQRPEVDFGKESVVILLAGSKPSGGYSVEPKSVRIEGDVLVVDAAIKPPPPDAIVTMAFTSPWAAIAVDNKQFKTVRWTP